MQNCSRCFENSLVWYLFLHNVSGIIIYSTKVKLLPPLLYSLNHTSRYSLICSEWLCVLHLLCSKCVISPQRWRRFSSSISKHPKHKSCTFFHYCHDDGSVPQAAPPNSGWWYFRFCAEAICRTKPIKSMMAWYWANTGEKIVTGFPGKEVPHTWWNQTSYSKPLQDLPLLTSRVDWHSDSSNKFQWSFSALQLPVGVFRPTSILLLIDSNTWNTNLSRTTSLSDFHPHE